MVGYEKIRCSLLYRALAVVYDLILLFAVLFFATALLTFFLDAGTIQQSNFFYPLYLLSCCYLYFVWHWVHGGQTLGMKAWKVSITMQDSLPSWRYASTRFFLALFSIPLFGFGILWSLIDSNRLMFYERFSETRLVRQRKLVSYNIEEGSKQDDGG